MNKHIGHDHRRSDAEVLILAQVFGRLSHAASSHGVDTFHVSGIGHTSKAPFMVRRRFGDAHVQIVDVVVEAEGTAHVHGVSFDKPPSQRAEDYLHEP